MCVCERERDKERMSEVKNQVNTTNSAPVTGASSSPYGGSVPVGRQNNAPIRPPKRGGVSRLIYSDIAGFFSSKNPPGS